MRGTLAVAAALMMLAAGPAGCGEDQLLKLKCVGKIGDNMYRAAEGTVVWTEHCGHEAKCEDAEVRRGNDPRIAWRDGSYCWVVKVAASTTGKRRR
jgi:hypothetical protein